MKRAQLEHVVRAAADITGVTDLVVMGSQAVLGSYPEWRLPFEATASNEVDVAVDLALAKVEPGAADETVLADQIDGAIGEGSLFHQQFGYYADGVEMATAALTPGWRDRLVPLIAAGSAVGWCLEVNDLWVSKAAAARSKDFEFCTALARAGLVDETICGERLAHLAPAARARAEAVYIRSFGRES